MNAKPKENEANPKGSITLQELTDLLFAIQIYGTHKSNLERTLGETIARRAAEGKDSPSAKQRLHWLQTLPFPDSVSCNMSSYEINKLAASIFGGIKVTTVLIPGHGDGWVIGKQVEARFGNKTGTLYHADHISNGSTAIVRKLRDGSYVIPMVRFGRNEQTPPVKGGGL